MTLGIQGLELESKKTIEMSPEEKYISKFGDTGQANRLMDAKK